MRRDDSEFTAYLAARWPALVRTLVFLGHSERDAHTIALDGLVRIFPDWSRLWREEDVDVAVYREVLDARDRHLRRGDQRSGSPGDVDGDGHEPPAVVLPGLAEQVDRRHEVEAALDTMTPQDRMLVVLSYVAELSENQIADVLDQHVGAGPQLADADVRLALESVVVRPLRAEDVAAPARARRHRIWSRTVAALTAAVLVAVGVSWVLEATGDPTGDVADADNPLPVAWYADGTLHLADVTVKVRSVDELVTVPDGVVMSDRDGVVSLVDESGEIEELGASVPGTSLVVEPSNGWVAWADPADGAPQMVVHDTRIGDEVGRRSLAVPGEGGGQPVGESGPVAIDGERVYYAIRDSNYVWEPLPNEAFALSGNLADLADGSQLSHLPGGYRLQSRPLLAGSDVSGSDGRLTADGRYAFVVQNEEVGVYDMQTGRRIERMYSPSDRAVGWTYTDGTFYFAVLHKLQDKTYQDMLQMPSEGNYRIYECVPDRADVCIERAEVPEDVPDPPILAR